MKAPDTIFLKANNDCDIKQCTTLPKLQGFDIAYARVRELSDAECDDLARHIEACALNRTIIACESARDAIRQWHAKLSRGDA